MIEKIYPDGKYPTTSLPPTAQDGINYDILNKINELVEAANHFQRTDDNVIDRVVKLEEELRQILNVVNNILDARNRLTARIEEIEKHPALSVPPLPPRKSRAEECAEKISHELRQSAVESRYAVVLPIIREYIKD